MITKILLLLLVFTHWHVESGITNCLYSIKSSKDKLFNILNETENATINQIIDDFTELTQSIPILLNECGAVDNS